MTFFCSYFLVKNYRIFFWRTLLEHIAQPQLKKYALFSSRSIKKTYRFFVYHLVAMQLFFLSAPKFEKFWFRLSRCMLEFFNQLCEFILKFFKNLPKILHIYHTIVHCVTCDYRCIF